MNIPSVRLALVFSLVLSCIFPALLTLDAQSPNLSAPAAQSAAQPAPLFIYNYAGGVTQGFYGDNGLAVDAQVSQPVGLATDAAGNLYIADLGNQRVRKITAATGLITTIAGNGTAGFSGDGSASATATLSAPAALATDAAGNLYIVDRGNSRIRKIDAATSTISTVAGNGSSISSGDGGKATNAGFKNIAAVAIDAAGNLFILDSGSFNLRKVDQKTGLISTLAGTGIEGFSGDNGPAISARISTASGLALDPAGNLYIADTGNQRIRKIAAISGVISTVAGNGIAGFRGDGAAANQAQLDTPTALAFDPAGNLYIADAGNARIRILDPATGVISTVAGNGTPGDTGDNGPALNAEIGNPQAIAIDAAGELFLAATGNPGVRVVRALAAIHTSTMVFAAPDSLIAGQVLTLSGMVFSDSGATPTGSITFYNGTTSLGSVALNGGSAIRKIVAQAGIYSITATYNGSATDAPSTSAPPVMVTVQPAETETDLSASANTLYQGDKLTLRAVVKASAEGIPSGQVTFNNGFTTLGTATLSSTGTASFTFTPTAGTYTVTAEFGGDRNQTPSVSLPDTIVVIGRSALSSQKIYTYVGDGTAGYTGDGGPARKAALNIPNGLAIDAAGNLYFAQGKNNVVRKVDVATGIITTIAGNGVAAFSGDGGPATAASLNNPFDVKLDAQGHLYIADSWNSAIRMVDLSTGIITTVAGTGGVPGAGGNGGPANQAKLVLPTGIALDAAGNLYISDDAMIRRVAQATGLIEIYAGTLGVPGYSGDGGPATAATLSFPMGLALDAANNLYIADANNNNIRRVDGLTQIITTFAGTGSFGYSVDGGLAQAAMLAQPDFVAIDQGGNVVFSDSDYGRIRMVNISTNIITTVAGIGGSGFTGDGGSATQAKLDDPEGIAFDLAGNLYISDSSNNRIRVVGTLPQIAPIATTTTLVPSATSLTAGQPLTLTATVKAASGAVPTGKVTFLNGQASMGSAQLDKSGVATLTLKPTAGVYLITASYAASATNAASVSSAFILTVVAPPASSTTTLTATPNSAVYGSAVTLAATITSANTPAGSVTFYDGSTSLGNSTLTGGLASLSTSSLAIGAHTLTAVYAGTDGVLGSTSAAVKVTVTAGDFKLTAAPAMKSVYPGQSASYNVQVEGMLGFGANVKLACSGLPADTTCTFSPATIAGGSGTATLTVSTTGPGNESTTASTRMPNPPASLLGNQPASQHAIKPASQLANQHANSHASTPASTPSAPVKGLALASLFLLVIPRKSRRLLQRHALLLVIGISLFTGIAITGCGGKVKLTGGTPAGLQTITVTATATNGNAHITHSSTVKLNVQPL